MQMSTATCGDLVVATLRDPTSCKSPVIKAEDVKSVALIDRLSAALLILTHPPKFDSVVTTGAPCVMPSCTLSVHTGLLATAYIHNIASHNGVSKSQYRCAACHVADER